MAPTIPVISAIITFLAHISAGNNLTAAQVLHTTYMRCDIICGVFQHIICQFVVAVYTIMVSRLCEEECITVSSVRQYAAHVSYVAMCCNRVLQCTVRQWFQAFVRHVHSSVECLLKWLPLSIHMPLHVYNLRKAAQSFIG
jgi:hypothetical protein